MDFVTIHHLVLDAILCLWTFFFRKSVFYEVGSTVCFRNFVVAPRIFKSSYLSLLLFLKAQSNSDFATELPISGSEH